MPHTHDERRKPAHEHAPAKPGEPEDEQTPRRAAPNPSEGDGVDALKQDMRAFAQNRTRGHRTATLRSLADRSKVLGIRLELRGAALGGMDLKGIDLRGAYLAHAHLRGADLSGVDLRDANLRDAKLEGARLDGTLLGGADLTGALLDGPHALATSDLSVTTRLPASILEADPHLMDDVNYRALPQHPVDLADSAHAPSDGGSGGGRDPAYTGPMLYSEPSLAPRVSNPRAAQNTSYVTPFPRVWGAHGPGPIAPALPQALRGLAEPGMREALAARGQPRAVAESRPDQSNASQYGAFPAPAPRVVGGHAPVPASPAATTRRPLPALPSAPAHAPQQGPDQTAAVAPGRVPVQAPPAASKPGRLAVDLRLPHLSAPMTIWSQLAPIVERRLAEAGPEGLPRDALIAEAERQLTVHGVRANPESFIDFGVRGNHFFLRGPRIASHRVMVEHARHGVSAAKRGATENADKSRGDDPNARTQTHHAKGWASLDMLANEVGEEQRGVRYTDQRDREAVALKLVNGEFVDATGRQLSSPSWDHLSDREAWSRRPFAAFQEFEALKAQGVAEREALARTIASLRSSPRLIFVMTSAGEFLAVEGQLHVLHHSTLLAGGAVAAAGELGLRDGKPTVISNESGHYRPGPAYLWQAVRQLQMNGVDIGSLKVEIRGAGVLDATDFLTRFDPTAPETDERHLSFDPKTAIEKIQKVQLGIDADACLDPVLDALAASADGQLSFEVLCAQNPALPEPRRLSELAQTWITEFADTLALTEDGTGLRVLGI